MNWELDELGIYSMVFSSLLFLFGFLPVFFITYYITPVRWRNITALVASCFFYAWGAPQFVFILVISSVVDYILSRFIVRVKKKKIPLIFSLVLNVGLLGYFKYANFFVEELHVLLGSFGYQGMHWTYIALPVGISFFTFQKISYIIDVYRGTTKPARNVFDFLLYVALFPQLIAGPIVRYHDIAEQIRNRKHSLEKIFEGIYRFCVGLAKKVLIANVMGEVADNVFALGNSDMNTSFVWLGIIAYAFQIYFDFSGYSDMAIGLGKMMGFDFLENFNHPYCARSMTDFWRRWHMSLSNFMREYVYIPLGGNRVSPWRAYMNLWIIFLLSGLWHGAGWTFIAWGAYQGIFLTIDKAWWLRVSRKIPGFINIAITFFIVLIGWVFFRAENFSQAWIFLKSMFFFGASHTNVLVPDIISYRGWAVCIMACIIVFVPSCNAWRTLCERIKNYQYRLWYIGTRALYTAFIFFLSVLALANNTFNPFIYFRF